MVTERGLVEVTVADYHDLLRRGEMVEAVVEGCLDRIEQYDRAGPSLNAVVTVNQNAVDRARPLDDRLEGDV